LRLGFQLCFANPVAGDLFIAGDHNPIFSFCFSAARGGVGFDAPDEITPPCALACPMQSRAAEKQKD
jgi:hypothetical protein